MRAEDASAKRLTGNRKPVGRWLGALGLLLALSGGLLVLLPGPAYRWQLLGLGAAFTLLRWGAYIGLAGGLVSMLALLGMRIAAGRNGAHALLAAIGLAIGAASFALPWALVHQARRVPPIHDITTDTVHPPTFDAILPLRRSAPNAAAYGGAEVARAQHSAYPDIEPLQYPVGPGRVFAAARDVAEAMGWCVVAAAQEAGRIEATATTFWFGFKDDVVIRIRGVGQGTRVDIRSVSRVGVSDLGKNAERIRQFRDWLTRRLSRVSSLPVAPASVARRIKPVRTGWDCDYSCKCDGPGGHDTRGSDEQDQREDAYVG